ncbi:ADP-ribosylglycohydrolase family protein [Streptomyces sp. HNM0575]|uniref:ADP-ribosylglycohydrolase family protein n=1 Tax=Streptomyces sp. HNM0575 TaxID=2716338 RepID=UPI00145DB460|nr:ADP-ribosylglycohydrolase family protein [Streptomyces sp. HNM0575]NLU74634.1 ADP-ribosylglycohydrolase family protein [Streptomyces sp. HNM0575]
MRLTWVQPEDLLGHELRQAAEDGRDASAVERVWRDAGGGPAPERAGASEPPADGRLRATALRLLDELALLPSPLTAHEPTELEAVKAACPDWPEPPQPQPPQPKPQPPAQPPAQPDRAGGPGRPDRLDRPERPDALRQRLEAAWLGRAAGCLLGKPVEKMPLDGIREIARETGNWPLDGWFTQAGLPAATTRRLPWNRRRAATSLAENIDGMPEDDDLNYPLLGLLLLRRHGHAFTTADVAGLWLDELPAGRTFTAERIAYRNLLDGLEPPETGRRHNPFREWIGALIRADVFGWTCPGDPGTAAELAWRDATLSHTANGVYGEMFAAAVIAEAASRTTGDALGCLRTGLRVVPPRSRLARAVAFGIDTALDEPTGGAAGFESVVDRLHEEYGRHHWVHVLPNAALLAAALTHARGDFTGSICRAVSGGWDTDSVGATAGSVAGLLAGSPGALPSRWTAPLRNRLATSVTGFDGTGFDTLAGLTRDLASPPPDSSGPYRSRARPEPYRPSAGPPAGPYGPDRQETSAQ